MISPPWQSKLIERVPYEDGLLNDFGVLHFDLGDAIDNSGFIKRTGPLLFAIVRDDTVYEIGVYEHGQWFELDILNTIDENWPELLDPVTLKSVELAYKPKNREEIKALREGNICSVIALKSGRAISPLGGGVATNGTSNDAVELADYWAKYLDNADKVIIAAVEEAVRKGELAPKDYHVRLYSTPDEIAGIVEEGFKIIVWKKNA